VAFFSTKTYGNDRGLSCCFRQWKATHSHCSLLHGYSLGFKFIFGANQLDKNNWVLDFGQAGFGPIKTWLHDTFDHTILIAQDDPKASVLKLLAESGIAKIRIIPAVGCEQTAKYVYDRATKIVDEATNGRVWVESVECFEHDANSAIYQRPTD
jgi:6-pyruvoyltetrahydropterin/6-carboxytetrahydropterin synthase